MCGRDRKQQSIRYQRTLAVQPLPVKNEESNNGSRADLKLENLSVNQWICGATCLPRGRPTLCSPFKHHQIVSRNRRFRAEIGATRGFNEVYSQLLPCLTNNATGTWSLLSKLMRSSYWCVWSGIDCLVLWNIHTRIQPTHLSTHIQIHTQTRAHTHTQRNTQRDKHLHTQRQKSEKGSIHHKKLRIDDRSVATNMWLTEDTAHLCSRNSIELITGLFQIPPTEGESFPLHCSKLPGDVEASSISLFSFLSLERTLI